MNSKTFFLAALTVLFTCAIASAQVEEITLSTYYPAPYGEYEEMAAEKLFADKQIIGNMDVNGDGIFSDTADINAMGVGSLLVENNVGIGTTGPLGKLDIVKETRTGTTPTHAPALYVTMTNGPSSGGVEFRHSNQTQGIGFGYNSIYATGTNTNQHLNLIPRGTGNVGIGTTGPAYKFETVSTDSGWSARIRNNYEGAARSYVYMGHSGGYGMHIRGYTTGSQYTLQLYNANAETNRFLNDGRVFLGLQGNVGIGTTSPQAKLDVRSTTSGFLPPRMTTAQRDNISAPPAGSVIYNTNENGLNLYNGSNWQGMGGWTKIAEVDLSSSAGYTFTGLDGDTHKMYKVIFQGYLAAGGADRHIVIRLNGSSGGYSSYACYDGHAGGGDWDTTGFYVGRNGWYRNCDFAFEYTISGLSGRRHVGFGEATFSHYPPGILGYGRASGYWNSTANVTSLWVGPRGGTISGKLILLALQ